MKNGLHRLTYNLYFAVEKEVILMKRSYDVINKVSMLKLVSHQTIMALPEQEVTLTS